MKTKQLHLTIREVMALGFKGKNTPREGLNSPKRVYELDIINGRIYYNPEEEFYVWYLSMNIGEASNHICLNIEAVEELRTLLKMVRGV